MLYSCSSWNFFFFFFASLLWKLKVLMLRQRWWIRNWLVTQFMCSWVQLESLNAPHEDIYSILCLLPWPLYLMPLLCCFSAKFALRCFFNHFFLYLALKADDPDKKMVCFSGVEFSPTHWSHSKPTCRLKYLTVEF